MPDTLNLASHQERVPADANTPALATLFLMAEQLDWLLENGGIDFAVSRTRASSSTSARGRRVGATPFVGDPSHRPRWWGLSTSTTGDAARVCAVMRSTGIVTSVTGSSGATRSGWAFPSIDPDDVAALTRC